MEMFHIQLVLITILVSSAVYFFYNKRKVKELSEQLLDKKIVINELAEHANKIEQEITSVSPPKPKKTTKVSPKSNATKVEKTKKSTGAKKETVVKSNTKTAKTAKTVKTKKK
jgi:hypothetical protein